MDSVLHTLLPSGDPQWWQIALLIADYLIKFIAVGVVPENRHPSSSTAWLLIILLVPFLGLPLFLLLGSQTITGRRHRIQALANREIVRRTRHLPDIPEDVAGPGDGGGDIAEEMVYSIKLSRRLTGLPAVKCVCHGVYADTGESIAAMTAAVAAAEESVHVQMYIFALDEATRGFVDALVDAHRRGVSVKVLVDPIGSRKYAGYARLREILDDAGIPWHPMLPIDVARLQWRRPDLRNHRKILTIDGRRAFMGSQNMIEPEYESRVNHRDGRRWSDVMVELGGDVVPHLDAVFAVDWTSEGYERPEPRDITPIPHRLADGEDVNLVQVLPSGPGFTTEPNLRVFNDLIYGARRRIVVVSPYFVPDESLLMGLTSAAYAGLEVVLQVNEKADQFMVGHAQQSYYHALLEAGVRILRFPAPGVLHSKFLVIDDEVAAVGSSNLDMRSFGLNYEVTLLAVRGNLVRKLAEVAEGYAAVSTELDMAEWESRPWWQRYLDNVFRLTSALQ